MERAKPCIPATLDVRRAALVCFLLMLLASGPAPGADRSAPVAAISAEQQAWLRGAHRHEKQGWIYLHIEGAPQERGFQHGYLLAPEIKEALRVTREVWKRQSGMEWNWLVKKSARMISPKVDPENRAEIDGIVEGLKAAGVDTTRDEMIAYNAI